MAFLSRAAIQCRQLSSLSSTRTAVEADDGGGSEGEGGGSEPAGGGDGVGTAAAVRSASAV